MKKELIRLVFDRGCFIYTEEFAIVIEGSLWPRELEAANQIVKLYKAESKSAAKS